MPIHIHPVLRAREEALEAEGLIKALDSVGVTIQKAAEASGKVTKVVPVQHIYYIRGNKYTAS